MALSPKEEVPQPLEALVEVNDARLVLAQAQPPASQRCARRRQRSLGPFTALAADYKVICVAHQGQPLLGQVNVELVQVDVGQERRQGTALARARALAAHRRC